MNAAGQEVVRAKVGVQILSGDSSRLAKSKDRLKAGNQLRIYVMPEKDSYVYVINSDRKHAVLLNPKMVKQKRSRRLTATLVAVDAKNAVTAEGAYV